VHAIIYVGLFSSYKAVGEINTTPQMTMEYLIPGPGRVRKKWDHAVKVYYCIKVCAYIIVRT